MEQEIATVKKRYPDALYLGIADGAKANWSFLEQHTSRQLLDFFHVTEYLASVSYAVYPGKTDKPKRTIWLAERCKQLKREQGAVETLISEMEKLAQKNSLTKMIKENLQAALTYFKNHRQMMDYAMHSGSRYFCESFYEHPCSTSGKNYATANACGGPSRPGHSIATQQGVAHMLSNDSTRFRTACIFTTQKDAS